MGILGLHPLITVDRKKFQHKFFTGPVMLVEDVLPHIPDNNVRRLKNAGMRLPANLRLLSFRRSHICVKCGLVGRIFVREKGVKEEPWHVNMYGINNGAVILMTIDHIIPKWAGGPSILENLQTMCTKCNAKKGGDLPHNVQLHMIAGKWFAVEQHGSSCAFNSEDWGWRTWHGDKRVNSFSLPSLLSIIRLKIHERNKYAAI